jgi:hypothetical protein
MQEEAQRKSEKLKALSSPPLAIPSENCPHLVNIFQNLKKPQTVALFGGQRPSVNLFQFNSGKLDSLQNGGGLGAIDIFDASQKPTADSNDEYTSNSLKLSGEKEDCPEQSQMSFKTEPREKVMRYEYKSQLTKLVELGVKKFKSGASMAKEGIYITL